MVSHSTITAFVLGIIVCLFALHAWQVYSIRQMTMQNTQAIQEIVQFINAQQGKAPASPTPAK